jgi:2-polyprenyl-3-methyl-5-hydroxy-6-metoxy-1,4-benzoquinol methylase
VVKFRTDEPQKESIVTINENDLEWVSSPCDWCGSYEIAQLFEGPDRLEGLPGMFKFVSCRQCGLYRQEPRLAWNSLKHYYPESYASHSHLVKNLPRFITRIDKRYGPWKRLKAVERYQSGGRMLEVGCGTGLFLEEALRNGRWDVTGIEPSEKAANYARENLNISIYDKRFSQVELPEKSFDVIAMWNVLEHLDHPISDLRRSYKLLKDHGWLVFAIPNMESLDARLFGSYWIGWDLPRHLYLFPETILKDILKETGFRWVSKRCISTSYATLGHSLDFWSYAWQEEHPLARKLLMKAYHSIFGRMLMLAPLWVLDRLNLSTIITVFAQKAPET